MRKYLFLMVMATPIVASAQDASGGRSARAHFVTSAESDVIMRVACAIDARVQIGGQPFTLDVSVLAPGMNKGLPASCGHSGPGTIPVTVQLNSPNVDIDIEVPANASPEIAQGLVTIATSFADDLRRRAIVTPPAPLHLTEPNSPAMTGIGIGLGVLGLAAFISGYAWLEVDTGKCVATLACPLNNLGAQVALMIGGPVALGVGALLVVIGEHRVPAAPLTPYVTPIAGGGAAGGFTMRF